MMWAAGLLAKALPVAWRAGAVAALALALWGWGYTTGRQAVQVAQVTQERDEAREAADRQRALFQLADRLSVQHQATHARALAMAADSERLRNALSERLPTSNPPAALADVRIPAGAVRSLRDAAGAAVD